jgi:hypothetical protein
MGEIEFWRSYEKQVGHLVWRLALPKDKPALERLWRSKERVLNAKLDRPDFFASPTLITLVAEDCQGKIVSGLYVEAVPSVSMIGASVEGFEGTPEIHADIVAWLRSRGFRFAATIVPKMLCVRMREVLQAMGFRSQESRSVYWNRWF